MIDAHEKKLIEQALSELAQADTEHWCDNMECTIDTPCCSAMHNRAAARKLRAVVDAEMVSLHPGRLTNPAERIYFDRWVKENQRHEGVNGGHTALELILCPPHLQPRDFSRSGPVPRPSHRDAEVATAIIQWLGTNCGNGFVRECERQITQENAERSEFYLMADRFTEGHRGRDLFQRMLDAVLKDILPSPARGAKQWSINTYALQELRSKISQSMRTIFTLFAFVSGKASAEECATSLGVNIPEFNRLVEHAMNATEDAVRRHRKQKAKETASV